MGDLTDGFEERLREIDAYLALLEEVQTHIGEGSRKLGIAITVQQQRILHSSVYLQLYNLVEATITRCIDAVAEAASRDGRWLPRDLSSDVRREWVRSTVRTDDGLSLQNHLKGAQALCNWLVEERSISSFSIAKGGGGNWDDRRIETFSQRLGLALNISPAVRTEVKRPRRNDKGALGLVKALRNDLAHGRLSFEQCGAEDTVSDLTLLRDWTSAYLREVVAQFEAFIAAHEFLTPSSRPREETA